MAKSSLLVLLPPPLVTISETYRIKYIPYLFESDYNYDLSSCFSSKLPYLMKNLSRRVIIRLFDFGKASSHGISPLSLLLFLFSVTTPFSIAQSGTDSPDYQYRFQGRINPSMTVVIVVLVCAFFFIGFFAVYLCHCTQTRSASIPINPRISAGGGLDPEVIETFPIIVYSDVKDLKIGKVPLECAVCLNEFEDDESLRLLPVCDHVFHPECIDAWLASNSTCPVCRTNLATETGEIARNSEQVPVLNESLSETNPRSELGEEKNQVSIDVPEDRTVEIAETSQTLKQNRPPRSRSTGTGKFPRSHSTGHSLVQPGQSLERFTLRLPEEVRKQIAMNAKLNRSRSNGVALPRVGSSRRGYTSGGEGSGKGSSSYLTRGSGRFDRMAKSDRWVFTMAPPFLSRVASVKSPMMDGCGDMTADGANSKTFLTSVKMASDSLGPRVYCNEHSAARPQV